MPSPKKYYKTRTSHKPAIPKSDWNGAGYYYKHPSTKKMTKWSRKRDLARGSKKTVGKPSRLAHTTDKNPTKKRRTRKKTTKKKVKRKAPKRRKTTRRKITRRKPRRKTRKKTTKRRRSKK